MEAPRHELLSLCEDVRLEIFKYLSKQVMENISLTCKCGYDVTKYYFEKKTQLVFSKPLTIQDFQVFSRSNRNYENVIVVLRKYDEIILDQLTYMKMGVTLVRLTTGGSSKVREEISKLKKYKTIKKVLIQSEDRIRSLNDIQKYKDEGIATNDITSVNIIFDEFDEEFYTKFLKEFQGLEELVINNEYGPINAPENIDPLNIRKITFHSEITDQSNFLQLFQGIHTLIIGDCTDSVFLKTLLDLNQTTLKVLQLNLYQPIDYDLVIPCQLETLTVFAECEHFVEHLISNQNELKFLNLNLAFTPDFLEKMGSHCAPNLNIRHCDYNSYIGSSSEIKQSIPELPIVKNLEINHTDLADFLPKTLNIETLEIVTSYFDSENEDIPGFESLDGLKLKFLKSIDISNLDEDLLNEFSRVKMDQPSLVKLRCKFNLRLLENYENIKSLEVFHCNFENILDILRTSTKLEELKVRIEIEDLLKTISHFEYLDFGEHFKYVEIITRANSEERFKILKKLDTKGDKVFSNYNENDKVYIVDVIVGIDITDKQFMYTFINV